MTNQNGQQLPFTPAPPDGYWLQWCSRGDQRKAEKEGVQRAAKRFVQQVKVGVDALITPEPNADKFVAACRLKPLELWAEHRAKFPDVGEWWDFRHIMERWQRLAPYDPLRQRVIQYIADVELLQQAEAIAQGAFNTGAA